MKHSKIPLSQAVVQLCKAKGIYNIVLSPGSRNAPLTIGFTNDDFFNTYSIVDERSAAFFALGLAQKTNNPVAVVCTSGSALLNYYPAVSEAFYSDIPLVVLSADRPEYLVGIGDGQTINQKDVFSNHVLISAHLKLDVNCSSNSSDHNSAACLDLKQSVQKENELAINKALNIAFEQKGPVHINIPFDEPLYEQVDELTVEANNIPPMPMVDSIGDLQEFENIWNASPKKMVLVGVNQPNSVEQQYLDMLASDESVLVFTETTSNIHHPNFLPSIDKVIAALDEDGFMELQPDLLLTFGGMIVSKKIKAFLRAYKPKYHWHIDPKKANDTFFCLDRHFKTSVNDFFKTFNYKPVYSNYRDFWLDVMKHRRLRHDRYVKKIPFSDFKVLDVVLNSLPERVNLQVGNSSAIRYTQLFDLKRTIPVFCNRGTSGIDGSTSTAIGYAVACKNQTVLLTGDLSFFYDSNALWNDYIPKSFRVLLINNNGGGIFRILPGHKNTENFDRYFETTHDLNAEYLCKMFGFDYQMASSESELKAKLSDFYQDSNQPKLLEVFTPRTLNDTVLLDYFKFIK